MKMSNNFFITRKELPNDEITNASKFLIKSGMIYKNDNGIYSYLPMGLKVLKNIKKIVREEMKNNNIDELLMPSLIPMDLINENTQIPFINEIFHVNGNNKKYYLCPTYEDLFAMIVKNRINSYKDLHFTLFQINSKFRDEEKTKYGLVRKKEFYSADAYSFDADEGGLDISYDKMYLIFNKIFKRLEIDTIVCNSDPMSLNGTTSEEFQALCEYGDNQIVKCTNCNYSTNIEYASSFDKYKREDVKLFERRKIKTKNIDELDIDKNNIINATILKIDGKYKMILLKNNSILNIHKLYKIFKCKSIKHLEEAELEKIGTCSSFVGPINCTMEVIADNEIKSISNAVVGANKKDEYYVNVNPGIDFKVSKYCDIKLFDENSLCPKCKSKAQILKGVEVGHIYKLETNYSKKYDLKYSNEINELEYVHMGSYGIGLDRCIDAIVESHHDEKGIIWPMEVSPYKVAIVIINVNDRETYKYANKLYEKLQNLKIDTILDDRKETVGVKFNDIDLMGIPIRITIGRRLEEGYVEFKLRNEDTSHDIESTLIIDKIISEINKK